MEFQRSEDLSDLAQKAGEALMDFRHGIKKKEDITKQIQAGMRVCELISKTWEALDTDTPDEEKSLSVCTMLKGIREERFQLSRRHFQEIAEETKGVKEWLEDFLANPNKFSREEIGEIQALFSRITGAFIEKPLRELKSLYLV